MYIPKSKTIPYGAPYHIEFKIIPQTHKLGWRKTAVQVLMRLVHAKTGKPYNARANDIDAAMHFRRWSLLGYWRVGNFRDEQSAQNYTDSVQFGAHKDLMTLNHVIWRLKPTNALQNIFEIETMPRHRRKSLILPEWATDVIIEYAPYGKRPIKITALAIGQRAVTLKRYPYERYTIACNEADRLRAEIGLPEIWRNVTIAERYPQAKSWHED